MKNPRNREAEDRSEMMCPRCQTEGLEESPYADEYDNEAASLLKATRCPNEDCELHAGVPREKIEMQMPDQGLMDIFNTPGDISTKDALIIVAVIGVGILMAASYGIGPFGSPETQTPSSVETNIQGSVFSFQDEQPEVLLYQGSSQINGVKATNGTYNINAADLETGSYTIYLNYSGQVNPPGKKVRIEDEGNKTVDFTSLPDPVDVNLDQNAGRSEFIVNYTNPTNIKPLNLNISPIEGESVERSRQLNQEREQNILMPVLPASQEYRLDAPYTYETFNTTGSYRGRPRTYEIRGNADAERIRISLPEETAAEAITESVNVPESGITREISVASQQTIGPAQIEISNGTSSKIEQTSGVWDNDDNITVQTGADEFVQGTLQIEPRPITTEQRIEGSITGTEINHEFKGNQPVEDAEIEFVGGDTEASLRGDANLNVNARNGSTGVVTEQVTNVDENGSYSLEWNPEFTQNQNLVDLFYKVNDNKVNVENEGSQTLSLSEGDEVVVGGEAELDTMVDDTNPPSFASSLNSDLEVTNFEFSDDNPGTDQRISVSVTIENTAPQEITDTVELYQNKERVSDERLTLAGGEEKTLGVFEFGEPVTSENAGLEVWRINKREPIYLKVGINERNYGEGNIQAELYDVGTGGSVLVDTNGDGDTNCEASADGGVCEFETFESGENTISVQEDGIEGTSYVIEYTSQDNPRGVEMDVGQDGLVDLSVPGVLEGTVSETIELPPGEAVIGVETDNQIPISYGLSWQSGAVINNPVVYVDGDVAVSDQGSFVANRTFDVGQLSQGTHNIRFESQSGGYEAEIKWREEESKAFPEAIIDNTRACEAQEFANNLTCVETDVGVSPGQHSLEFQQTSNEVFNYKVEQDARAVASNVQVNVNGQSSESFARPNLDPEPWETVSTTSDFIRGENNVNVTVEEENGLVPEVDLRLRYLLDSATVENIDITVVNSNGTENTINLPRTENQQQIQRTTVNLDKSWFTTGNNTVRLEPEPVDGVFEISGGLRIHSKEDFRFRTLG